jgi:thioredoxin reductase (NADPH)
MIPADNLRETPDTQGAFPRLSDAQIRRLAACGVRRPTRLGEVLFEEGRPCTEFFVILAGKVAVVEGTGPDAQIVRVHGSRRFLGELGLLAGQPAFVSTVVVRQGVVLAVPVRRLWDLVTHDPTLGDLILRAYLVRRSLLIDDGAGFRIIGSCFSPDSTRLREFAARNRLPHRWFELEQDEQAENLLRRFGVSPHDTPIVIWRGGLVLRNPSNTELARVLGLPATPPDRPGCDLLVVGTGPAGLAAAVYAASDGLDTVIVDAIATGGQAGTSPRIENYLGFPAGISGADLIERAAIQATKFGAHVTVPASATALEPAVGGYRLRLDDGTELTARAVVIATGARYRRLDAHRVEDFAGSVYYAATQAEAAQCRLAPIVIVGGGNSAGQAALFLAQNVPAVHLICRGDLAANMSRYLVDQINRHSRIEVLEHTEARELLGDDALHAVAVEDTRTGNRRNIEARALFVFIGMRPETAWLAGTLDLDRHGFIRTGVDVDASAWLTGYRRPLMLETSLPGVFATGDVRSGSAKRIAAATGEGATAVRLVHEHLGST